MHKGTIFYINPENETVLRYFGKEFIQSEIKNPKKLFIGSRIFYQDMILHSIKANINDLKYNPDTFVEMKMYEEIGLDLNKEYKIGYIIKDLQDPNSKIIDAYAIETEKIKKRFSKILKKAKHIDFLAIPFLSYKALYQNKVLEKENDIFITINEREAFVAFYKEGKYISSKSLPTLEEMAKEINKSNPSLNLDAKSLKKILLKNGLKKSSYPLDEIELYEAIIRYFSSIFTKISNIAIHNRNIYGFQRVDRIFFGIEDKTIKGVEGIKEFFRESQIAIYRHSFFKEIKNFSQLDLISATYIYNKAKNRDENGNITIFAKKPSLLQTQTGKFILSLAASVIILSLFPIYKEYRIINLQKKREALYSDYEKMQNNTFFAKEKIEKIKKEINSIKKEEKIKTEKLAQIERVIDSISTHIPKREYIKMIAEIDALLEKYRLEVDEISQKNKNELTIKIVSKQNRQDTIAKFIKDINENKNFSSAQTDEIKLEDEEYSSLVKINK